MLLNINTSNNKKLNDFYLKAINELYDFFEIKLTHKPNIFFVESRLIIDSLKFKKTPNWLVGWTSKSNVFLLKQDVFGTESNRGKINGDHYYSLFKHEICHVYLNQITNNTTKPLWFLEGICLYLSGQLKYRNQPKEFRSFLQYYSLTDSEDRLYEEPGFVIETLVKKYGKSRLLELIFKLQLIQNEIEFKKEFKKIYNFDLNYQTLNENWVFLY